MTVFTTRWLTSKLSFTIMVVLTGGLVLSLFLKARWLWMDEVISYVLLTDPSLAHTNQSVVSGLDANPPLSMDVYWLLGHSISLSPMFLRSVSAVFFATTVTLFYRYVTQMLGRPAVNFVVITLFVCFTYLNLSLATQVRSYALFALLHLLFFLNSHRLALDPTRRGRLLAELVLGTAVVYTHNFGLLYVATMAAFFAGLAWWSGRRAYWAVLGTLAGVGVLWFVGWFANFRVQSLAGKPHSWIPLPTVGSFFRTVGELLPSLSAHLEASRYLQFLPALRVFSIVGLLFYLGVPRLRQGYAALIKDPAGLFLVQAGFVAVGTTVLALMASFTVVSVFLNRYLWPNHLLFAYVAVYAYHYYFRAGQVPARRFLLPAYAALLLPFIAYQNRKVVIFPSGILAYLPALDPRYPVFFESADYFLPIWYQHLHPNARFLLDWPVALRSPALNSTVDYNILASLRDKYHVPQVVPLAQFDAARFPRFYVVDEHARYLIEPFLQSGQVRVLRTIPTAIVGHQILECTFASLTALLRVLPLIKL